LRHPAIERTINVPYSFLDPDDEPSRDRLDTVEIGLKYANFSFEEHGLLLGGGIESQRTSSRS
jgi:hypothetical protein